MTTPPTIPPTSSAKVSPLPLEKKNDCVNEAKLKLNVYTYTGTMNLQYTWEYNLTNKVKPGHNMTLAL